MILLNKFKVKVTREVNYIYVLLANSTGLHIHFLKA